MKTSETGNYYYSNARIQWTLFAILAFVPFHLHNTQFASDDLEFILRFANRFLTLWVLGDTLMLQVNA